LHPIPDSGLLGTSISLLGNLDQCAYDVWLDGNTSPGQPQNGKLAEFDNLDPGRHRILLTVHPSAEGGGLSFYGAEYGFTNPSS
jgi:hypothetical protein